MRKEIYIVNKFDNMPYSHSMYPVRAYTSKEAAKKYVDKLNEVNDKLEEDYLKYEDDGAAALRQLTDLYIEREYPEMWEKLSQENVELDDDVFFDLDGVEDGFIHDRDLIMQYVEIAGLSEDEITALNVVLDYNECGEWGGVLPFYRVSYHGIELVEDED